MCARVCHDYPSCQLPRWSKSCEASGVIEKSKIDGILVYAKDPAALFAAAGINPWCKIISMKGSHIVYRNKDDQIMDFQFGPFLDRVFWYAEKAPRLRDLELEKPDIKIMLDQLRGIGAAVAPHLGFPTCAPSDFDSVITNVVCPAPGGGNDLACHTDNPADPCGPFVCVSFSVGQEAYLGGELVSPGLAGLVHTYTSAAGKMSVIVCRPDEMHGVLPISRIGEGGGKLDGLQRFSFVLFCSKSAQPEVIRPVAAESIGDSTASGRNKKQPVRFEPCQ